MGAAESGARTGGKPQWYRCFLVRCRRLDDAGEHKPGGESSGTGAGAWRFTVEQVRPDANRHCFATIDDVAAFIDAELVRCESRCAVPGPRRRIQYEDSDHPTHPEVEP